MSFLRSNVNTSETHNREISRFVSRNLSPPYQDTTFLSSPRSSVSDRIGTLRAHMSSDLCPAAAIYATSAKLIEDIECL